MNPICQQYYQELTNALPFEARYTLTPDMPGDELTALAHDYDAASEALDYLIVRDRDDNDPELAAERLRLMADALTVRIVETGGLHSVIVGVAGIAVDGAQHRDKRKALIAAMMFIDLPLNEIERLADYILKEME